jgi:hypothetical protein
MPPLRKRGARLYFSWGIMLTEAVHWGAEIEIFDVGCHEAGIGGRDYTDKEKYGRG